MTTESRLPADAEAARRRELAAGLVIAGQLLKTGRAADAIAHCHKLQQTWPDNANVLRYLGLSYLQAQQLPEAERFLADALRLEPASPNLLNDLGIVQLRLQAYEEALRRFTDALDIDPKHSDALGNIAALYTELNQPTRAEHYLQRLMTVLPFSGAAYAKAAKNCLVLDKVEDAIRLGRKAVRFAPLLSEARLSLAEAMETCGRLREAKYQYLTVLRHQPRQVGALTKLLSMRRMEIDDRHARAAQELLDGPGLQASERAQLHLALARYLDQRGQYDAAFGHLKRGNSIAWKRQVFDSGLYSQAVSSILDVFTSDFLHSRPVHEGQSTRPIFIVGMPRSGTTLVEQILASHSAVAAGGELSMITNLATEVSQGGAPYPRGVRLMEVGDLSRMAGRYLERLERVSGGAPRVTDKMPFNFMHLGLISMLFPDAAIIHCCRGPMDTCLSCYFTSFGENLLFASDLDALGRYYLDYRRMMEHWHAVLPKVPLDVDYEQLVLDTEKTVRTILAWCGMDWEPACLEFYRTDRGIRTPSRWQVRQPIYPQSVGRWRAYEKHLQPLLEVLEPVLHRGNDTMPQDLLP